MNHEAIVTTEFGLDRDSSLRYPRQGRHGHMHLELQARTTDQGELASDPELGDAGCGAGSGTLPATSQVT